jgi:hypothetical protein
MTPNVYMAFLYFATVSFKTGTQVSTSILSFYGKKKEDCCGDEE